MYDYVVNILGNLLLSFLSESIDVSLMPMGGVGFILELNLA